MSKKTIFKFGKTMNKYIIKPLRFVVSRIWAILWFIPCYLTHIIVDFVYYLRIGYCNNHDECVTLERAWMKVKIRLFMFQLLENYEDAVYDATEWRAMFIERLKK